ncbi:MAG: DNA polymerase III subunit gamma/tau [Pseudomonadales bacterium]|nr:DNA polymerase III subunit gamma/tau [Pseudomonadales bacterium]MBO6565290.1 DNA polymerase III subunit gamma/tau [Pseudomonadales bacterium]MBO6595692.1 DNA polymerase III subunit gamma/tau [Pseudomonadales bacterium]MBO6820750.1 DNA polymerase III subunit gamma/tau [Pseudomonadales bacterium]
MNHQVLARKYRPASFQDLEGQEHVLQALVNALDNNRLHHAYLFTGTRGVGKTTIARILARCLNCETGVTSTPCGKCNACLEIAEGRSVDLIEVDAASRTGVDDMRELLDNVQYMPTVSRFKIYLIDEVHMLSRSSFNAMLKTLEEPPEHVKFLFATTDPKKLPITVLSRCLQFNLKNMTPEQIVHYLGVVLGKESIVSDESALWQLGHAADGSMRDALSLTDQAISFGNGEVREEPVRSMLGAIDQREVYDLLDAIVREDGAAMLAKIAELSEYAPDYAGLLDDMMSVLHRVAIAHAAPEAVDNAQGDRELILKNASKMTAELVQLLYQIGLIGQRDLPLAPTARMGFEMVLLRMMSFTPDDVLAGTQGRSGGNTEKKPEPQAAEAEVSPAPGAAAVNTESVNSAPVVEQAVPDRSRIADLMSAINGEEQAPAPAATKAAEREEPAPLAEIETAPAPDKKASVELIERKVPEEPVMAESVPATPSLEIGNWSEILSVMSLDGMTRNLAANCLLDSVKNDHAKLKLAEHHASLWNQAHEGRIAQGLSELFDKEIKVSIEVGATDIETPAQIREREQEESRAQAVADIESDHHVQQLIENFNGKLDPGSIRPLGS